MLLLEDHGLFLLRGEIAMGFVVLLELIIASEAVLYPVSKVRAGL